MLLKDVGTIRSSEISCSYKIKCDIKQSYLFIAHDDTNNKGTNYFDKMKQLITNMNLMQKQFFIHYYHSPKDIDSKDQKELFVYCPMYNLMENKNDTESAYINFQKKDKLYLSKWIFSAVIGTQILHKNNIELIRIFNQNIFIDSNMEARISYSNFEESIDKSVIPMIVFYAPPEDIDTLYQNTQNTQNTSNKEEKLSFSLGVLIMSLLNWVPPKLYFRNTSITSVKQTLKNGGFYDQYIPDCPLKPLIEKCLSKNPEERPKITEILKVLISEEACLERDIYTDYLNWLHEKFGLKTPTQNELFESIQKVVNTPVKNGSNQEQEETTGFKITDIPQFLELASQTSFYDEFKRSVDSLIDDVANNLPDHVKPKYNAHKDKRNKCELIIDCLHASTEGYSAFFKRNFKLFSIDNMKEDQSFTLSIMQQAVRLIIPKSIKICPEYFTLFNNDPLFVTLVEDPLRANFYPFLNVYNLLYGEFRMKRKIEYEDKVRWLLQTSRALARLHERGFSVEEFSSQDVFIDIDFNAHFFPTKMKRKDSKESTKNKFFLEDELNYHLAYNAPEVITGQSEGSTSESRIVFSFGVFICELLNEEKPGNFLYNLSYKEKKRLLKKKRTPTFDILLKRIRRSDCTIEVLMKISESCLEIDPSKRKLFNEISGMFNNILPKREDSYYKEYETGSENPNLYFDIKYLKQASQQGSVLSDEIFKYVYQKLNGDDEISFNSFLKSDSNEYSKCELALILYNHNYAYNKLFHIDKEKKDINNLGSIIISNNRESDNNAANNFHCGNSTEKCISEIINYLEQNYKEKLDKINSDKINLKGLQERSCRLLIHIIRILEHPIIEISIKSSNKFPYGDELKLKYIEKNILEFNKKLCLFGNRTIERNGNGNILLKYQKKVDIVKIKWPSHYFMISIF
ncbi:hypothetical protein M9Y10_014875 [Tritrichomonas musculus]|uniref:Protein kinase domain-containing protein n=1 Tax=Tritrichomonas musculus TaxID=1915356 RepID=A0ABR2L0R5_9EUKA